MSCVIEIERHFSILHIKQRVKNPQTSDEIVTFDTTSITHNEDTQIIVLVSPKILNNNEFEMYYETLPFINIWSTHEPKVEAVTELESSLMTDSF